MSNITFFEKLKKELNIIHHIFHSQFQRKSALPTQPLLHQDGRYCTSIYVRSDNEDMLAIEPYKMHFTERYENSIDNSAVKKELALIKEISQELLDYFNSKLTLNNPVVADIINERQASYRMVSQLDPNAMIMLVENFDPAHILFGFDGGVSSQETEWTKRKYNYFTTNKHLAEKCAQLIVFCENFDLSKKEGTAKSKKPKKLSVYEIFSGQLTTIAYILYSQFQTKKEDTDNLLNEDGRYCTTIEIYSDREWNTFNKFRRHYTKRFESVSSKEIMFSELTDLYRKSDDLVKTYNLLFANNEDIKRVHKSYKDTTLKLSTEEINFRTMSVLVRDYYVNEILFGKDWSIKNLDEKFPFQETFSNDEIVEVCGELINFVNDFKIPELQDNPTDTMGNLNDEVVFDVIDANKEPERYQEFMEQERKRREESSLMELFEDHLEEKHFANRENYLKTIDLLFTYYQDGNLIELDESIVCKNRTARPIAWSLYCIHKEVTLSRPITYNELIFFQRNISIFHKEVVSEENFRRSNLYRYFTQNPNKNK